MMEVCIALQLKSDYFMTKKSHGTFFWIIGAFNKLVFFLLCDFKDLTVKSTKLPTMQQLFII